MRGAQKRCKFVDPDGVQCPEFAHQVGYCRRHYARLKSQGIDPSGGGSPKCTHVSRDGVACQRVNVAGGYCHLHYRRSKAGGDMDAPVRQGNWRPFKSPAKRCTVEIDGERCTRIHYAKGMCSPHYWQTRSGKTLGPLTPPARRFTTAQGYISLSRPEYEGSNSNGTILEHRYLAEQMLGRRLTSVETVHHRNGKRDENTIGSCLTRRACDCEGTARHNLELWDGSQPSGQRLSDKLDYVVSMLEQYGEFLSADHVRRLRAVGFDRKAAA